MSNLKVYEHPTPSPSLHQALKSVLPYGIDLIYRIQHPSRTPYAHILATFPPSSPSSATPVPKCWAAAYFDRSARPETELWIFAAGEVPLHYEPGKAPGSTKFCPECKKAVHALLDYMSKLPTPPIHESNLAALEKAKEHEVQYPDLVPDTTFPHSDAGSYVRHLLVPGVVTLGSCNEAVVDIIAEAGLIRREFPGIEARLNKFFFKVSSLPETRALPDKLRWGEVRESDLATVQARTPIPRTARTMMSLKSVGVFEKETGRAVSWTFLGLDGSLTTLHTEDEWRGKGIAKAIASKIFKEHAPELAVDEEGNAWAHANVYEGNVQSESVCKSLSGWPGIKVFWVRIDLTKAGSLVRE